MHQFSGIWYSASFSTHNRARCVSSSPRQDSGADRLGSTNSSTATAGTIAHANPGAAPPRNAIALPKHRLHTTPTTTEMPNAIAELPAGSVWIVQYGETTTAVRNSAMPPNTAPERDIKKPLLCTSQTTAVSATSSREILTTACDVNIATAGPRMAGQTRQSRSSDGGLIEPAGPSVCRIA